MINVKRQRSLIIDLALTGLASVTALALRENFTIDAARLLAFVPYLVFTLAVAGPILVIFQLDRAVWRFSGLADYVRAVCAAVLIVIAAVTVSFVVNRLDGVARSLPILQAILLAVGLVGVRVFSRIMYERRRRADRRDPVSLPSSSDTVLLVGWSSATELFIRSVAEFGNRSIHIAGILSQHDRHVGRLVQSVRVLGTPDDVREVMADLDVHGIHVGRLVIMTSFDRLSDTARQILLEIESTTDVRLDFFAERLGFDPSAPLSHRRVVERAGPSSDTPGAFEIDSAEIRQVLGRSYWSLKRAIDAIVALVLLIALAPIALVVAFVVALDVGLPILFIQQRPGLRGVRFNLYKFRTMGPSHDLNGHKIPDSQRLSRVGDFLRRTRLDELPQLFNILVGDMSFVGPRPLVSREQSDDVLARLLVRPGLTGWAQVRGGRVVSVADKTALDLWYVRHASLALDFKILAETVPMVLFGERVDRGAVRLAWRDLRAVSVDGAVGQRQRTG
jgi:lipopolysaccharide/colanic/teichoic acid biosynthesis glycosyltransferase